MMRYILVALLVLTIVLFFLTMLAGLQTMHGQEFFISHLKWAMAAVFVSMLSNILAVMYAFKVESEYSRLASQLPSPLVGEGQGEGEGRLS